MEPRRHGAGVGSCDGVRIGFVMAVQIVHPNPLIQALQLAGADWLWPGDTLSLFWRTTTETMSMAGWAGYSNPWQWRDVRAAHLKRLRVEINPAEGEGFRLESCMALWLQDGQELKQHSAAIMALREVYLSRIDPVCLDEESALFWAAMLAFDIANRGTALNAIFLSWRESSPNAMRWLHAHQVVHPFGMELWPTARHMHRIVSNATSAGEATSLEGLLT